MPPSNKEVESVLTPFELQEIVRKYNNNPNLTDSGYAKAGDFTIWLDGCMEWSSVHIEKNGVRVYKAHQHASNNWAWEIQKNVLTDEELDAIRTPVAPPSVIKEQAADFGRLAGYVVVAVVAACLIVATIAATVAFVRWIL